MWKSDPDDTVPTSRRNPRPLPPDQRKRRTPFARPVGTMVAKLTAKAFERYGFHSAEIMMSWPTIVGDELAKICIPEKIKWPRQPSADSTNAKNSASLGATLILRVAPAHALDLEYRAAEVGDRINRFFGYRAIAKIKILQAPLTAPAADRQSGALAVPTLSPAGRGLPSSSKTQTAAPLPPETDAAPDEVRDALATLWSRMHADRRDR